MIVGLDHVIVGVADLDAATAVWRDRLGFAMSPGGVHDGLGSHNVLLHFPDDYMELLAVFDPDVARPAYAARIAGLADEILRRQGLMSYALVTDDIEGDTRRLQAAGVPIAEPLALKRTRPDGIELEWHCALMTSLAWQRRLPFLIQRPAAEPGALAPPVHPNGTLGVASLAFALPDVDAELALYEQGLGLPVVGRADGRVELSLGATRLQLVVPAADAAAAQFLADTVSPGLYAVRLRVADLDAVGALLAANGVRTSAGDGDGDGEVVVDPRDATGADLGFVAA